MTFVYTEEARDGLIDPLATNFKSQKLYCFEVGKPVPNSDSDYTSEEYKKWIYEAFIF